jgi:hypothetical protein
MCLFRILVKHPVALARVVTFIEMYILFVSAVGMFEGCLADIQRIGPMSESDIFWTSIELTCVMCCRRNLPTFWAIIFLSIEETRIGLVRTDFQFVVSPEPN